MRRLPVVVALVVLLGAGGAAYVLTRPPSGPFPTRDHVRVHGLAAWPVDTVEEAERECAEADEWRLDERETALRFAREILRYPNPHSSDWSDEQEHRSRYLVGSDGTEDLFLGSLLEVQRFGRCWYVTGGSPREGDVGATLGFVYRDGRAHLLLGNAPEVPSGFVGFGDWEAEIDPGQRQVVMWMPELGPDATGHVIYTRPDEQGVSEFVGVRTLGSVPPPPEGPPAEPVDPGAVAGDPELCRGPLGFQSPERAIGYLYQWTFDDLLQQVRGHPRYERRSWRHLDGDRWRLVVDDAVLTATIPEIDGRCYALASLVPVGRDSPLRRLWLDETAITVGVDWGGGGDEATVSIGSGFTGSGRTLKELREPVTFPHASAGDHTFAGVVLYKDGHVVSAYYGPYGN